MENTENVTMAEAWTTFKNDSLDDALPPEVETVYKTIFYAGAASIVYIIDKCDADHIDSLYKELIDHIESISKKPE